MKTKERGEREVRTRLVVKGKGLRDSCKVTGKGYCESGTAARTVERLHAANGDRLDKPKILTR